MIKINPKLAEIVTNFFIRKSLIKDDERLLYNFCFEILLADILNLSVILILSFLFHRTLETLCYISSFILLRSFSGGYHAKRRLRCFTILIFSYSIFLVLLQFVPLGAYVVFDTLVILISVITVYLLAPIENPNKHLTATEICFYKTASRRTVLILSLIFTLGLIFHSRNIGVLLISGCSGMLTVSISVISAKFINLKRREYNEESND